MSEIIEILRDITAGENYHGEYNGDMELLRKHIPAIRHQLNQRLDYLGVVAALERIENWPATHNAYQVIFEDIKHYAMLVLHAHTNKGE